MSGGAILLDGPTSGTCHSPTCAPPSGCAFEDPRCSRPASGRTSATARPEPARRRSWPRWTRPRRTSSRTALGPGHQDRRAGHGAVRRPAAAGGARPRHPGPARPCCCSTTRCPRWTCTPRPRSPGRWPRCWPASTALVVAHRPSTVMLADRVALLDGGVITATGSHQELLATQPRYRELMSGTATRTPNPGQGQSPAEPDQDTAEDQDCRRPAGDPDAPHPAPRPPPRPGAASRPRTPTTSPRAWLAAAAARPAAAAGACSARTGSGPS